MHSLQNAHSVASHALRQSVRKLLLQSHGREIRNQSDTSLPDIFFEELGNLSDEIKAK